MNAKSWRYGLGAAGLAFVVGGCALDPSAVPIPGATVGGDTYPIHIEFANALNLPAKANVVTNGAKVGNLAEVRVVNASGDKPGYVVADVDISESVKLPANTTAELSQNTVLGDIYIALVTPPRDAEAPIKSGGTIPLSQTKPPMQIEDMLAGISTFISGGAVTNLQDIITQMNSVLPQDLEDTRKISEVLAADFRDVAQNLDEVSRFGKSVVAALDVLENDSDRLSRILSDQGAIQVTASADVLAGAFEVIAGIGGATNALMWTSELVKSLDAVTAAFVPLVLTGRPLDLNQPSNLRAFIELLQHKIFPWTEHGPKVNVAAVHLPGPPGSPVSRADQTEQVINSLRMIGMVR